MPNILKLYIIQEFANFIQNILSLNPSVKSEVLVGDRNTFSLLVFPLILNINSFGSKEDDALKLFDGGSTHWI